MGKILIIIVEHNTKEMDITLCIELLVRLKQWIPSKNIFKSVHEKKHIDLVTLKYLGKEYTIKDERITKWFPPDEEEVLVIPPFIFEDIVGDAPDDLPIGIPLFGGDNENTMKARIYTCILMTYIGAIDYAWDIQVDIHSKRKYLPEWWRNIGGLNIIEKDIPVQKYDGSDSKYTLKDFNGTYLPVGLSSIFPPRVLLQSEIEYQELWKILEKSTTFQDMMFGIREMKTSYTYLEDNEDYQSHDNNEILIAASILGTESWEYAVNLKRKFPPRLLHLVPKEYLYNLLQCYEDRELYGSDREGMIPNIISLISTLSPGQISRFRIPIDLLLEQGLEERNIILPTMIYRIPNFIMGENLATVRKVFQSLSDDDIKYVIAHLYSIIEIDAIYPEIPQSIKEYTLQHISEKLISSAGGFINQLENIGMELLQDISSYMEIPKIGTSKREPKHADVSIVHQILRSISHKIHEKYASIFSDEETIMLIPDEEPESSDPETEIEKLYQEKIQGIIHNDDSIADEFSDAFAL